VVKEQQYHPVKGDVIHMDFLEVNLDEKIEAEVSLELEGTEQAPGVREGGVLEHVLREVTVEALPTEIPEVLVVDVSGMEINDNVTLEAVVAPEGVTIVADEPGEVTVATLSPPRVEEEPEPSAEEETELIGEEGEAAEGEEAAGGEGGEESGDGESEDSGSGDEEG
jgi:large subunit ribosomal protein L25